MVTIIPKIEDFTEKIVDNEAYVVLRIKSDTPVAELLATGWLNGKERYIRIQKELVSDLYVNVELITREGTSEARQFEKNKNPFSEIMRKVNYPE